MNRNNKFLEKVNKTQSCWFWAASKDKDGYGQFWDGDKLVKAHRWAYEHFVESIPEYLQIDHLCEVKNCVNPRHLEPVTGKENIRRSSKHKEAARKNGRKVGLAYGKTNGRKNGLASRKYNLPEGVSPSNSKKNPYRVFIRLNGRQKYLGCFPTPQEAYEVYQQARKELNNAP